MVFFLIEIPFIEIKWIWLQLNTFTTFYDLMHETVIDTFFLAILKTNFPVRFLKYTFTEDQQITKNNKKWDEFYRQPIQRKLNEYTFKREQTL